MTKKVKILILNLPGPVLKSGSRWYNTTKGGSASLKYYPYPWFMGYLTSLLKENGYEAKLIDAVACEWSDEETRSCIESYKPTHIICEPTWVSAKRDNKFISSLDKKITKIGVGNFATNFPKECLKTGVSYVAVGEYEYSILEYFQKNKLPVNFTNKDKEDFKFYPLQQNLDVFPFPERDDTPQRFFNEPSCYGRNIVMTTSRGCRFNCSFCNVESFYGQHCYRVRSPKNVVDEIEYMQKNYDFDEIYFDDDNMVARKSHVDGICREIIERGVKVRFCCMGDARVDDETLKLLAKAECTTNKIRMEHTNKMIQKAIPKDIDPRRSLDILKKCRQLGIRSYANIIVGLPKSTYEKDMKMLNTVFSSRPDLIQIGIATPYPGTKFYQNSKTNGWLKPGFSKFDVTGESTVNYPNYFSEEITQAFHKGWKMWYKHVMVHQPKTLWFFFSSEVRRNGLANTISKTASYILKAIGK